MRPFEKLGRHPSEGRWVFENWIAAVAEESATDKGKTGPCEELAEALKSFRNRNKLESLILAQNER